ncbi:MAG: hypothetical protein J6Q15_00370, partial [Clostridia bacterium]|nr:hypothetical protein [Clostridia bacterium]
MRVVDQSNCVNDIIDLIISKAMYQKVVFCLDDSSDVRLIDTIAKKIERKVSLIKYYYNKNNVDAFNNIVNNGVRVTVYNVSSEHFYVLQNDNSFILNIFIPQSSFVLPYITCGESMYGDNLLVCDMCKKDYISIICMYYLALNRLLELLVNDVEVDTQIFKDVDWLVNCDSGFYSNLINMVKRLRGCLNDCYKEIDEEELPCYVYLQLYSIFKMFDNLN